ELYSFEASPYARPVRELLCELELPYVLHNSGRTSMVDWVPPPVRDALNIVPASDLKNRRDLLRRAGRISIPYLIDPNSGTELSNSTDICSYLNDTYSAVDEQHA
ncbi:MAG: glutathione S-transferase N-terminal domain-containing protein, partial [Gammaproteobacteria bacterium]|nr:glutathione S-transferase N-terminal domain-containing protein [Gammaproteobacteria bacterium]NNL50325.1 glutathione S-transferase [Woeseiaceae bacterium]